MPADFIYAIDFGTTNSLLAAANRDQVFSPTVLDDTAEDPTVLRSVMYFSREDTVTFGQSAINQYAEEQGEGRFIRSIKKFLPAAGFSGTKIGNQKYDLEHLIGRFLREMKTRADARWEADVSSVVLGRPALFSEDPKLDQLAQNRLANAARLAGFKDIEFFPEPLAAAFDYRKALDLEQIVLVVDLGGGTSDFTVIRLRPNQFDHSDILAIGGVSVAGDALDGSIMSHKIAPYFASEVKYRMPMGSNVLHMPPDLKHRLMSPADITLMSHSDIMFFLEEVKKCTLSERDKNKMENLFVLISDNLGFKIFEEIENSKRAVCMNGQAEFCFQYPEIDVREIISMNEFIQFVKHNINQIFQTMDNVIARSGLQPKDIDLICCTGGTAKVPLVQEKLISRFGVEKIKTLQSFHSVIQGLARRGQDFLV